MAELVREIEEAAAAERQETGKEPLGEEGIRAQDPETHPRKIKKSPASLGRPVILWPVLANALESRQE
jgi:hypothetical protein